MILKDAEFGDEGYYSCVFSIHHNGKQYNITKTVNITVIEGKGKFVEEANASERSRRLLLSCSYLGRRGYLLGFENTTPLEI